MRVRIIFFSVFFLLALSQTADSYAVDDASAGNAGVISGGSVNTPVVTEVQAPQLKPASKAKVEEVDLSKVTPAKIVTTSEFSSVEYTLGQEDVIEIEVLRHPEFSGTYPINLEGKIQYKFVGDIDVNGLTKYQLEEKLSKVLSTYIINPEVNVMIVDFKSKYFFVLGEVRQPGKYYMMSERITVRDAVVAAGLPISTASMRRCKLITPSANGNTKTKSINIYSILYGGNLKHNIDMKPGDVLYVPSTVMAKVIRVVNPITAAVGLASSGPSDVGSAKTAAKTLAK